MRDSWDQRIGRARQLAAEQGTAAPLLTFYARLLESQKEIYDSFHDRRPSGSLERDANQISEISCGLLQTVADHAPEPLSTGAKSLLERGTEQLLRAYSQDRSDDNFFGKAILQPYRQWMVDAGMLPVRTAEAAPRHCPRCDGAPQLAILDSGGASDEGSSRRLFCANCLAPWPFARIVCPYCGENDEKKLAYFHTPAFEHLRVDACDSCKRYLKSIDLTRLGLAVPLVDEVAGAPLDLWAREQGYKKIELNLFGL